MLENKLNKVQENLLNIEMLHPESGLNNINAIVSIPKEYSEEKIKEILNLMIKNMEFLRLEILPTKLSKIKEFKPLIAIEVNTLKDRKELKNFVNHWKTKSIFGFDKPLYHFSLVELGNCQKQLLIKFHHLISDIHTITVFSNNFVGLLLEKVGEETIYPQKGFGSQLVSKNSTNFWKKELSTFEGSSLYKSAEKELKTAEYKVKIPKNLIETFQNNELANKVSFFDFYLAGMEFAKKIRTYSSQASIGIATERLEKDAFDSETILLPLAMRFNLNKTVRNFLIDIKNHRQKVENSSDYTISQMIEEFGVDSFDSLTDISCMEISYGLAEEYQKMGFSFFTVNSGSRTTPLTVLLYTCDKNPYLVYEYQREFISSTDIDSLHLFVIYLLQEFLSNLDKKLQSISLVQDKEITVIRNSNIESSEITETILDVFEKQVKRSSGKRAVRFKGESLTFGELDEQSSALSEILTKEGIQKGQVVATTITGIKAIVAIFGILKAGAIYLPIDMKQPKERIRYILNDSSCALLLTDDLMIAEECSVDSLILSDCNLKLTNKIYKSVEITKEDLAYIIYTSGSTGVPKGVLLKHKGVVNMCASFSKMVGINENDVVQQFASLSFDASILEIFGAILNGCCLVMVDDETKQDPVMLQNLWDNEGVTFAIIPPVYMKNLDTERSTPLKYLMTAGEEASWKFILPWKDKLNYINAYGPSEATVWTTSWSYENYDLNKPVPIGRAIPNVQCYIFQDTQECGLEIPGELCISGESLGAGYINNGDKNKESFFEHPKTSEILYRTGDIAYWDKLGQLVFCGRNDNQVKIRGHRIDLSEITTIIAGIQEVVEVYVSVLKEEGLAENKELTAYIVLKDNANYLSVCEQMRNLLPSYMYPHHIIQVESLPMTINGKVDKRNLPKISVNQRKSIVDQLSSQAEKDICLAFEQVLRTTISNIHYDFYALGGDSIKAIRIVSKLRNQCYELSTRDLIDSKSISEVADHMVKTANKSKTLRIDDNSEKAKMHLSPIQQDFFRRDLLVRDHFNQCQTLFSTKHLLEEELKEVLQIVSKNHQQFSINFNKDNQPFINKDRELFLFEVHDFRNVKEDKFLKEFTRICQENQENFELEISPLFNAVLFHTANGSYLFMVIHHLIIDGVSWRILNDEIEKLYENKKSGIEPLLPEETITFQDWTLELEKYQLLQVKREKIYWENINNELEEKYKFVTQSSSTDIQTSQLLLSEDSSKKLLNGIGTQSGYHIMDIFVASLVNSIKSKKVDIVLESHGREAISDEVPNDSIIGWFTTYYPVIFDNFETLQDLIFEVSQKIKQIPNKGLNYLAYKEKKLQNNECIYQPQIIFNFLGDFQEQSNQFKVIQMDTGLRNSAANSLWFPLTITGISKQGKIEFDFQFQKDVFSEECVNEISRKFKSSIEAFVKLFEEQPTTPLIENFGEKQWSRNELSLAIKKTVSNNLDIEKIYPLSSMQENFLFNKMYHSKDNYIVQVVMEVQKELLENKVREAIDSLVSHYGVLRTAIFYKKQSIARNVQLKNREIPLTFKNMKEFDEDSVKRYISDFLREEKEEAWDFEDDPLFRVCVVSQGSKSRLIWSFHHILMDGWCLDILNRSFIQFYDKVKDDSAQSVLPQYSDYVNLLQQKDISKSKTFWKNYLHGFENHTLMIPEQVSLNRLESNVNRFSDISLVLSSEISQQIYKLGTRTKATVGTILEAAWGLVLQGYSFSNDVVFGKIISGRDHNLKGIEEMVGLFINTIPVRIQTNPNLTVKQLLKYQQVKNIQSEQHQTMSLADLNNMMGQKIESLFSFDVFKDSYPEWMRHEKTYEQTDYPLNVLITRKDTLNIKVMFDSYRYNDSVIVNLLKRYKIVLEQFVKNENVLIGDLEYTWPEEKESILENYSKNEHPNILTGKNIVSQFKEKANSIPNKVALKCRNEKLDFAELDKRSTAIANLLLQKGVHAGDYVLSLYEKSIEAVVAFLGILKAQAVYVPIDYNVPKERLTYILEDSGSSIVLTTNELNSKFLEVFEKNQVKSIVVDKGLNVTESNGNELDDGFSDESLAYIIYTSGTTGKPKGVMIQHDSAVNMALGMQVEFDFSDAGEILLQFASLAFDASILEILTSILNGHTLIIVPEEKKRNPELVAQLMNDEQVTWAILPPVFANEINPEKLTTLKYLKTAGEAANIDMIERWRKYVHYSNGYGPTEATVWATTWFVDRENFKEGKVSIGRPAPNVSCYILQKEKLCGIGMVGELCIVGISVGRGYLNNKQLTKEKFISYHNQRLYRTGDYARWLEDGTIEFLGRKDNQVKIRGNRIELSEIENQIEKFPQVQEAVVLIRTKAQEKEIVAYITGNEGVDLSAVRKYIADVLPTYMIPAEFIKIDSIPVTFNGKIDRKQLLESKSRTETNIAVPREEIAQSSTFQKVYTIFSEILDGKEIGQEDDFFALGGHSIKAARLINRINRDFHSEIDLNQFFNHPTISYILDCVSNKKVPEGKIMKEAMLEKTPKVFPATATQKRIYALQMVYPDTTTYNMPTLMKSSHRLNKKDLTVAFHKVLQRYEILRAKFKLLDTMLQLEIDESYTPEIEIIDCDENSITTVFYDNILPFNLETDQLVRLKLLRTAETDYLFYDIHHAISDGKSASIFIKDLMNFYLKKEPELLSLSSAQLNEMINQENAEKAEKFWKEYLREKPTLIDLKLDYPRVSRGEVSGKECSIVVDTQIREGIVNYCAKNNLTMYMFFVSITMLYLHNLTNQEDIIIGTPISSRIYDNSENTFGMYANTLPLRGKITQDDSFDDISQQIKTTVLNVFENQSYPLEKIFEINNSNSDYSRNPLFDVFLAFNQLDTQLQSFLEKVPMKTQTSPFDLTIDLLENDEVLTMRWEYKEGLFKEETIIKWMKEYLLLIKRTLNNKKDECVSSDKISELIESVLNRTPDFSSSFLSQGGDSIKAIRLSSKLADQGMNVAANDILSSQQLNELFRGNSTSKSEITENNLQSVTQIFEKEMNIPHFNMEKSFLAQGGDSIRAIRIISKLREQGIILEAEELLRAKSMKEFFENIPNEQMGHLQKLFVLDEESAVPVSPIIEEFFEQNLKNPDYFNQAILLELNRNDSYENIIKIFDKITREHSIFKDNFQRNSSGKNRFINIERPLFASEYYEMTDEQFEQECKAICENMQGRFQIDKSSLLSLVYFKTENHIFLFICVHHLVFDGVSWRILLDDFSLLKNQLADGELLALPYKTLDYQEWLKKLQEHGDNDRVIEEIPYWNKIISELSDGKLILPDDKVYSENDCFKQVEFSLNSDDTREIQALCNPNQDIQINDILLSALAYATHETFAREKLSLNLEGQGRETISQDAHIERTIGWFTTVYPIILNCSEKDIWKLLFDTQRTLRKIPNKGFNYGILKYCKNKLKHSVKADCAFNYLGSMDMPVDSFNVASYDTGRTMDLKNSLWSPLNVNGLVQNGCLSFVVDFNKKYFSTVSINHFCQSFKQALYDLVGKDRKDDRRESKNFSLSPAQEGLLFQKLSDESSKSYSTQTLFEIVGKTPDLSQLKIALQQLSRKHHSLGLKIIQDSDQEYQQNITGFTDILVNEYDYSNVSKETSEILTLVSSLEMNKGFQLDEGNLFRASIILAPQKKVFLLFSFHHIVFDGWSLSNLLITLSESYQLNLNGNQEEIQKYLLKPDHYENYLEHIQTQEKGESKRYWIQLLSGYDSQSDFQLLETQNQVQSTISQVRCEISHNLYEILNKLSLRLSVTKNTILEVIWGLVLQRYNYSNDAVFGKVVSGRNIPIDRIEDIVGMLINTIPIRISATSDETVSGLIQKNQKQSFDSQNFQNVSLSTINQWLSRKSPLVSTIYSYSSFAVENQSFELSKGTSLKILKGVEQTNYDVSCSVHDDGDSMFIQLAYNPRKFLKKIIENILQTMENILEYICMNPESKVKDIQVLNQAQLRELYFQSKADKKDISLSTIPEAIQKNAITNPERVAIHYENQTVTFQELEEKSNAIANLLISKGVQKEEKVGIFLPKTPLTIISMLGVMKSGACCVTMDITTPLKRVKYQLNDAEARFIFTDESYVSDFEKIHVIQPDRIDLSRNTVTPNIKLNRNNLAYILYTSGSTGNPKGSLIEYKGLMNLFDYIGEKYHFKEKAKVLQFASLSFDASVLEIFGSLVNNAELILVPENIRKSPDKIVRLMREKEVTFALIPPVMMSFFKPEDLPSLKYVMNAGDEASPEMAKIWSQKMHYINAYGPSEATIWTTDWNAYQLNETLKKCPIGKPIQNVSLHILNNQVLVGEGMPGELCISGVSLSRGYLNKSEITQKTFFENKLISPTKIYRTGDLVRRLQNGDLEYLGRVDKQVKIRGYRIELGEIEENLQKITGIDQVACCIIKDEENDKHLIAYIVSKIELSYSEVRARLKESLPDYMIPDRIIRSSALPMTVNGKIDRKALEKKGLPSLNANPVQKMSGELKKVSDILEEISGNKILNLFQPLSTIITDSITAMRASAKLKKAGYNISIKDILEGKSFQELNVLSDDSSVKEVNNEKKKAERKSFRYKEKLEKRSLRTTYKATKMQKWIFNQPAIVSGAVFDLKGNYTLKAIEKVLRKVISMNGVLRSSYDLVNQELLIKEYSADKDWYICMTDISSLSAKEIDSLYSEEQARFEENDIFQPNQQASELIVFKEKVNSYRLYLRIHHIFWDARSAELFEEQVRNLLDFPTQILEESPSFENYAKLLQLNESDNIAYETYKEQMPHEKISHSYNERIEKNDSDVFSTIVVQSKENSGNALESNLWGVIGKILLSYNKQFNKTVSAMKCSPAFILFRGRSGKSEVFRHTMGMFLELIPVVVWNESVVQIDQSLKEQLENYKNLKKDTFVDFLTYISHLRKGQTEPFDLSYIPVINFLGIYDFLDESEFFSNVEIKKLKKKTSKHSLIISVKDEAIHISMYAAEDKAMALKADIEAINLVED